MISKPADEPMFNVCQNAACPGHVHVSIGTGMRGYNVTPELAEQLATALLDAATAAREFSR